MIQLSGSRTRKLISPDGTFAGFQKLLQRGETLVGLIDDGFGPSPKHLSSQSDWDKYVETGFAECLHGFYATGTVYTPRHNRLLPELDYFDNPYLDYRTAIRRPVEDLVLSAIIRGVSVKTLIARSL